MKIFTTTSMSAFVVASVLLSTGPAYATDSVVDLANQICKGGDILKTVQDSSAVPSDKAAAFGEAAGQADAGNCGVSGDAVASAFAAWFKGNSVPAFQVAFNDQRAAAARGKNGYVAGLETTDKNSQGNEGFVARTLVATKPGESPSKQ